MKSYRLESSFFSENKNLTLYITGVTWLDKNMERVKINLKDKTATNLPQDVILENATRNNNNWVVHFSAKFYRENNFYEIWNHAYYDEADNEYNYDNFSRISYCHNKETKNSTDLPLRFNMNFTLENYPYDSTYLCPCYSRILELPTPIKITVK